MWIYLHSLLSAVMSVTEWPIAIRCRSRCAQASTQEDDTHIWQ